jgi:hypothetical protein
MVVVVAETVGHIIVVVRFDLNFTLSRAGRGKTLALSS